MKNGMIKDKSGNKAWYLNGKVHRENGPAIEYANGNKAWYINDKLHRGDGPAVEWSDGNKEYWLEGRRVEDSDLKKLKKQ